jgi:two-component system response regulator YesN
MSNIINIIIADDDFLIKSHIKNILAKYKDKFFVCGDANNGKEVIELVEKTNPDIIISDIEMPQLNGIDMQNELNNLGFKGEIIMLSNYSEFEYVKKSLKNGAIDYILKHQISEKSLIEVLNKAKVSHEKKLSYDLSRELLLDSNLLKENLIKKIISGKYQTLENINAKFKKLNINIDISNIAPIFFSTTYLSKNITLETKSLIKHSIINLVNDIISKDNNGFVCYIENNIYIVLISFNNISEKSIIETITNLSNKISVSLKKYLNLLVNFVLPNRLTSILSLKTEYYEAVKTLNKQLFTENNINKLDNINNKKSLFSITYEMEKEIISLVETGQDRKLDLILSKIFTNLKSITQLKDDYDILINELIGLLLRICKKNEQFISKETKKNIKSSLYNINNSIIIDDIQTNLIFVYNLITMEIDGNECSLYSKHIKKAIYYIKHNYKNEISLLSASNEINISSVYLSKLFKNEVGYGFSEYIQQYRILKSQELLLNDLTIKEAASNSGFKNYSYFLNVFKKKTGVTPTQFIHNNRQINQ